MSRKAWWFWVLALWVAVLVSGVYLVSTRHQARTQFIAMQKLAKERDKLATEWSQLQIEQSALANHARIDRLAREKLKLKQPKPNDIVVLGARRINQSQ